MQNIIPSLWFNKEAEEAANFYTSIFKNSKISEVSKYDKASAEVSGQPEGSVLTVEFEIEGYRFTALNGGPAFKLNPSISFFVSRGSKEEVDKLWEELSKEGKALMPLDTYPFSERYGWIQDKYGVSWQVILSEENREPNIMPSLMFVGDNSGRAEEAINFYVSIFENTKVGQVSRYEEGMGPDKAGTINYADFTLLGEKLAIMDSAQDHKFNFSEAISLQVMCDTQEQIDKYWNALSAVPESEQCGWLKDKYGVSWQIVPKVLIELLYDDNKEKASRAMKAMLEMKKLEIEKLKEAFEGE